MTRIRFWWAGLCLGFLQACGGGGGGDAPPVAAPTAVIRGDAAVQAGLPLALDGRQSTDPQGRALTYLWEVTTRPAGSDVALRDNNTAQPTVTATTMGAYVITLRVNNGAATGTATLGFSVTPNFTGIVDTAQLRAGIDVATSRVTLAWKDVAPKGSSYRIESRNADGSYALVDTVAGLEGLGVDLSWQRAYAGAVTYRVRAAYQGALQNLQASDGVLALDLAGVATELTLSQPEPVAGGVTVSVTDRTSATYSYVGWYLDGVHQNFRPTGRVELSWGMDNLSNGTHTVQARLMLSPVITGTLTRTVQSSTAGVALRGYRDGNNVVAVASSDSGIASVRAQINGADIGTLQAPNYASPTRYVFPFNPASYVSGNHTARVTATNGAGTTRSVDFALEIRNSPVITMTGVKDGAIVSGPVTLSGTTAASDGPRPITTRVAVSMVGGTGGQQTLVATTAPEFSIVYDFGGVPGTYAFDITSTDSFGSSSRTNVIVLYSSLAAYSTPLGYSAGQGLLAADDASTLYLRDSSTPVWRRGGTEIVIGGSLHYDTLRLQGGRVFGLGMQDTIDQRTYVHVVQWGTDGVPRSLSAASPFANPKVVNGVATSVGQLVAAGSLVAWSEIQPQNDGTHIELYDADTGLYRRIAVPVGLQPHELVPYRSGGVAHVAYTVGTPWPTLNYDVYDWASDTGVSTRRLSGNFITGLVADAARLAYLQANEGLFSLGSGATTPVRLAATAVAPADLRLADGLLVWIETGSGGQLLKAKTATGAVATVATIPFPVVIPANCANRLAGTAGGHVVYTLNGATHRWSAASGTRLLVDYAVCDAKLTSSDMYHSFGETRRMYRTTLEP